MSDKYKIPEGYEWEVHNLHAYADKKKAFERGEITLVQLREFNINIWKVKNKEQCVGEETM